jgi:hypothetical protein
MVRTQETVINWLSGDERVSVFTTDKSVVALLEKLGFHVEVEGEHEFMIPISAIRFSGTKTKTGKAKRELTPEQRTAIGVRLQTAKAAKFGLTMDQYRSLKLRPGQKPTAQQMLDAKNEVVEVAKPKRAKKSDVPTTAELVTVSETAVVERVKKVRKSKAKA